jgi:N-acetylglucosamine kinase-like BadF-type ATPase
MSKKQFPNGVTNYLETYFEVVTYIINSLDIDSTIQQLTIFHEVQEIQGRGGLWELAEKWTDEFETTHKNVEWDGDWFDVLYKFLENKVNGTETM